MFHSRRRTCPATPAVVFVGGRTVTTWIIASYRTQFDRVIRAESYGSLHERLQEKAADAADAER
jgi:hypothetical protein